MHPMRKAACFPALVVFALLASACLLRADDAASAPAANTGDDAALNGLIAREVSSLSQLKSLVTTILREDPELAKTLLADPDLKQLMARAGITLPDQAPTPTTSATPAATGAGDAQRTAKEELAQAQAMADAALASRAAADSSDAASTTASTPATSDNTHYTTSDLVNSPDTLTPQASDPTHHSMSSLIDGPQ